ncbi:hypothetical protein KAR91_52075 [Candidatus Pacearchaeota archaeon]|nr:hypothetical protein [Candidatus Pacearchaeota archaeon]
MPAINPKTQAKANTDTAKKDAKEREFEPSINIWHRSILLLFASLLRENSIAVQVTTDLINDLSVRLTGHYFKTASAFAGFPVRTEIVQVNNEADKIKRNIQFAINSIIQSNATTRATQISNTTNSFMNRSMIEARKMLGEDLSIISFTRTATNILKGFLLARVGLIAMTETQYIAETTRNIQDDSTRLEINSRLQTWDDDGLSIEEREEMAAIGDLSPSLASDEIDADMDVGTAALILAAFEKNLKQWVTMGDGKVRTSHKFASGQTVQINQPFIVGSGSELMFPGDTSLGAPIREVVNCRCYTAYL